MEDNRSQNDAVALLRWQDEVLQLLYWIRGEGLGDSVRLDDVCRFIAVDRMVLVACLQHMRAKGLIEGDEGARFQLTPAGVEEGRRRFIDEFEPLLSRGGHGQCNDPDCDCHDPDQENAVCRNLI